MVAPLLTPREIDVLGEVGNMSMGSAATSLSTILKKEVRITTPQVKVRNFEDLFGSFKVPYIAIKVEYTEGLDGFNILVVKLEDAKAILDIMLGGKAQAGGVFGDMEMSALAEVMNQMMGSAATALNHIYKSPVSISAPQLELVDVEVQPQARPQMQIEEELVTVSFRLEIDTIVDSEIIHVVPLSAAKRQAELVLKGAARAREQTKSHPASEPVPAVRKAQFGTLEAKNNGTSPRNLELLMDLPLEASVVLGSVKRTVREVLGLAEGSVLELDKLVEEPVDLCINGKLVAKGEIVVVNENFGLRITEVVSPSARIDSIKLN